MEKDNDMDAFIRSTLSSLRVQREKNFEPIQQTVVSTTSTNISIPPAPLTTPPLASGEIFGGGGSDINFPFKITTTDSLYGSGKQPSFKVSHSSSIIDGTNGGPFDITNLNQDIPFATGTSNNFKFIVASATVTSNPFEVTDAGFTISLVDEGETDEVLIESGKQTKLRLLIGKITVEPITNSGGTEIGKRLTPWQAVTTSFRTATSFHNGIPVYILQVAATHQSRI
jgi:hypothetical protein